MPSVEHEPSVSGPPVPRDRLLDSEHRFRKPSFECVSQTFRIAHEISEALYAGDGVWRDRDSETPLVRWTSRRVLGYIGAYRGLGDEVFLIRAREGLEHLLDEQKPSGTFVWYNRSVRGIDNRNDGLYETGIAGRAFVEGYRLFRDPRYLEASAKAARWAIDCPISLNNNYNMFAVWHLAAHYVETGDQTCLESAIHKTREGGFTGQFESGGWPGHNSWIWYHGIIIRGMAELYRVLPQSHPFRAEMLPYLTAAINRVIREQEHSGAVPSNPNVPDDVHRMCFVLQGLLTCRDSFGNALDNVIHGIERARISTQPSQKEAEEFGRVRAEWLSLRKASEQCRHNDLIWSDDFERFRDDADWGEMGEGWFNCWYPMNDPSPETTRWMRNPLDRRAGTACQEYCCTGSRAFGGIGFEIPRGLLTPGQAYRFDAWVKCRETEGAREAATLVYASVYSGRQRPNWDCLTECVIRNEQPDREEYGRLSVPFTASGDTTYVYVWMHAEHIPPGESVSMLVDGASVLHTGKPLPEFRSPLKYHDWDCDVMVTGSYLERMFHREPRR